MTPDDDGIEVTYTTDDYVNELIADTGEILEAAIELTEE